MRAGRLRNRVIIEQLVAGSPDVDGPGEPDETWTEFATVWGSIEPMSGKALTASEQQMSEVDVQIRIRYLAGITAKMRARFGTINYEIKSIINYNQINRELLLLCATGVSNG